jgi:hypothetical protein
MPLQCQQASRTASLAMLLRLHWQPRMLRACMVPAAPAAAVRSQCMTLLL